MVVAIIPARYASTRLPGKPLLDLGGKPMIVRVAERARRARLVDRVIVAADDVRIASVVMAHGFEARMTSPAHRTGTDRLAEVARGIEADLIVNIQGDEPLLEPAAIDAALEPLVEDGSLVMSTTCEPLHTSGDSPEESIASILDPNVVKVVRDREGFALYFSRAPIPLPRDAVNTFGSIEEALRKDNSLLTLFAKHTGLYAYRRSFLIHFASLAPTELERIESLEQLRALQNGFRIKVVAVNHRSIGVDTEADLERLRDLLERNPDL
ncbi:MAG: 3-deoxy-manno-octulosonate cytidylyltransferase [Acidobacteriota bacterium]